MLKRLFLIASTCLAFVPIAAADTLDEAMASALETNPAIAAARARVEAAREQLPQARAEGLPSVTAGAGTSSTRSGVEGLPDQDRSNTVSVNAAASQTLYAGGRIDALERVALARIEAAEANYAEAEQTLLLQVAQAYAAVIEAQAIVEARTRTTENIAEQRRLANARAEAGVSTRTDVAQADARLAQARTQLIQADGALAAAVETYRRLVGDVPSGLTPPGAALGVPATLQQALDRAGRTSPALRSARASENAAEFGVDVAEAAGRPRVALEASAGASDALGGNGRQTDQDSVGLRLSVPLFSGGAIRSRTREAQALRSAAGLDRANAEAQVRESVTNAWTGLSTARAAREAALAQVEAAEVAYRGVRLEYELGLRTATDALNQENDLLAARLALASSERELIVAERRLLAAMGELAPGGGIAAP
jgi:outer membrane protein